MRKIRLLTDSTCDLTTEICKEKDIHVIPLYVNFDDESYRDGIDITVPQMFEKYYKTKVLPKTSTVTTMTYQELFKKYIDDGYDVLYCGIGGKFSSNMSYAIAAAGEFPEGRVIIADSENLSTGIGLSLLKAAKMRDEGLSAVQIKEKLKDITPRIRTQFAIDSLEFLHKGGRCSGTARLFGTLLKIHPIIRVVDGEMVVAKKPRGRYENALETLLDYVRNDIGNIDPDYIMVTHVCADADALYLKKELEKMNIKVDNIVETFAGATIATHCGQRTIGILYILKEKK